MGYASLLPRAEVNSNQLPFFFFGRTNLKVLPVTSLREKIISDVTYPLSLASMKVSHANGTCVVVPTNGSWFRLAPVHFFEESIS